MGTCSLIFNTMSRSFLLLTLALLQSTLGAENGLLITGGDNEGAGRSAELWSWDNTQSCQLPSLPSNRDGHTQNGNMICGGWEGAASKTCLTLSDGEWSSGAELRDWRDGHTSWSSDQGLVLVGGWDSEWSTEMVLDTGVSEWRFDLQHSSYSSCIIDEGETFLLTGDGTIPHVPVSRYDVNGWLEDLDNLNTGRQEHGCAQFTNKENQKVNLVCGGWDDGANILSSCEMNIAGTSEWIMTTPLPLALGGLRGVTLEGRVLMTGGSDQDYYEHDQVWELNTDTMEWSEVGNIGKARRSHAVTAVDINDYLQYCQQ